MGLFKPKAEKVYERVASEYPDVFNRIHAILVIEDPQKIVEINVKLHEDFSLVVDGSETHKRHLWLKILVEMGSSDGARAFYLSLLDQVQEKVQIALGQLSERIAEKYPNSKEIEKIEVECINLYCKYLKSEKRYDYLPRNLITKSMSIDMWKECLQVYSSKGKIDLPTWKKLQETFR